MRFFLMFILVFLSQFVSSENFNIANKNPKTYSEQEILNAANDFLAEESTGLSDVIHKVFSDLGNPSAFIAGTESVGKVGVGLRFGVGILYHKARGESEVHWRGPSFGFDSGRQSLKTFVLIYNLDELRGLYKRFPSGESRFYYTEGYGVSYKQRGEIIIVPIRTGEKLKEGINAGWIKYSPRKSIESF